MNNKSGFTLIEIILAVGIGIILVVTISAIATSGFRNVSTMTRRARLHANAILLTDTLSYWTKQAIIVTPLSSSSLKITLPGIPATSTTISQSGTQVFFASSSVTTSDVSVTSLLFTPLARSIRVNFTLKAAAGPETLSATTTFAQRNSL